MSGNDKKEDIVEGLKHIFHTVTGTLDYTDRFKEQDRVDNRMMAMLSYVIPPIPFIAERHSEYVKFHSNQGMNLFVWWLLITAFISVVDTAFPWEGVTDFFSLVTNILLVSLIAFGIINTLKDFARELPIVSKLNIITIIGNLFGR